MLDIGLIIPGLVRYGGAERLFIECVRHWQSDHHLTIYSTRIDHKILRERGVDLDRVRCIVLSPFFDGPQAWFLNGSLLPRIWERELGIHQIYVAHQWQTLMIDRHPLVWYSHEPCRARGDLRFDSPSANRLRSLLAEDLGPFADERNHELGIPSHEAAFACMRDLDRLASPDHVVANSRYSAGCLEQVYRWKVSDVIYPGINPADYIDMPFEKNRVVTINQLSAHKRIHLAIEAIALLEEVELYVVGRGPERERLEQMAADLGVADRVFFLPGLTDAEKQVVLARCMAVVFTPIREPFGIAALEAMAAGRPLIAVNEGGYTEVADETCAFFVPPEPPAIAEKIRYLRGRPEAVVRMGAAGQRIAAEYTWERTACELLQSVEKTHQDWLRQQGNGLLPPPGDASVPLFGIHYHAGYQLGKMAAGWKSLPSEFKDMPRLGYYSSTNGTTIERHLSWIAEAGFDFAVVHIRVDDPETRANELVALRNMFGVADRVRSRLRFAVQISYQASPGQELHQVLSLVRRLFMNQARYLKLNGQPLLLVESSTPPRELQSLEMDWLVVGGAQVQDRGISDTVCRSRRILTVNRSFIEQSLNGDTLWEEAIGEVLHGSRRPDLLLLSSFNDYCRGTSVEPSVTHGSHYWNAMHEFIARLASIWKDDQPPRVAM